MKWLIIITAVLLSFDAAAQSERKFVRRGNRDFDTKKYPDAEIQYKKALEKSPSSVPAIFNLGNALYKQNHYDEAAKQYQELAGKESQTASTASEYYNLGNALYKSGKYKECIDAYKNTLRQSPGDLDAKHNLQLAMRKLQMQQQQQKNNQQKNNQKNDKNKKDNNKDQKKDQQNQDQDKDEAQKNQQEKRQDVNGQISQQDADRILQALENEEKKVLKRVQDKEKQNRKIPVDKNW